MLNRRHSIYDRIKQKIQVIHTGFELQNKPSPCHLWTGPTSGSGRGGGYGRMSLNSHTVATHLVVFVHFHGYIPGNRQVDHLCNQRLCCNPEHLELVSHVENQKRRAKRTKNASKNNLCSRG